MMNIINLLVVILVTITVLTLPLVSNAIPGINAPLVPCDVGAASGSSDPCEVCHFFWLVSNVITFLLIIMIPIAAFGIAVGAFYLIASAGRESWKTRGKTIILHTIFGLIIALAAWLIISLIIFALVNPDNFPTPWNNFPDGCS